MNNSVDPITRIIPPRYQVILNFEYNSTLKTLGVKPGDTVKVTVEVLNRLAEVSP